MSKTDRIKEELGWLKVAFGIAAVIGTSVIGWLVQNYQETSEMLVVIGIAVIVAVAVTIVLVNRRVYRRLDELEEL